MSSTSPSRAGKVRILQNGALLATNLLDLGDLIAPGEEVGLLGLAFAPDYATSGRLFVNFLNPEGNTVIARFRRSDNDPLAVDPDSRFDLVWPGSLPYIVQPVGQHNGGNIQFGPDGALYIGMGDGGGAGAADPNHLAQNPMSLLGKMLRIDVNVSDDDPEGYDVPADNPFVGVEGVLGEIWSLGLRNPWRWSFDDVTHGGTGALLLADVGEGDYEEVNFQPAGRGGLNYGWRNREGAHDFNQTEPPFSALTDPFFEYDHTQGHSITGGYIYRGSLLPESLRATYFFGDFIRSRVWSLQLNVDPNTGEATAGALVEHTLELGDAASFPSSFGTDANGELYIVNYVNGTVYRLIEGPALPPPPASNIGLPGTGSVREHGWRHLLQRRLAAARHRYPDPHAASGQLPGPGSVRGHGRRYLLQRRMAAARRANSYADTNTDTDADANADANANANADADANADANADADTNTDAKQLLDARSVRDHGWGHLLQRWLVAAGHPGSDWLPYANANTDADTHGDADADANTDADAKQLLDA
jgi:glucose/arabinose dehydrogenase